MKSILSKFSFLFFLSIIGNSCANYKLNIAPEAASWESLQPPNDSQLKHRMYLVGDAGKANLGETTPVLKYLKSRLAEEGEQSSIIYLGDNIYPDGMPGKESKERELAEHRLTNQLEILDNFKGQPIFIPGNHDWNNGLKGLARQEKFVNKYLNKGIEDDDDWETFFYPEGGCPGPEVLEINDQLVVIVIDSEWWLADWDKEPKIHDGCEVKNKFMFKFLFENAVRKYRNKNVVVALHHPLYSNGPHGGNFTLKQHIFPLTTVSKNLYIPLPGLGTIAAGLRKSGINKQDISNPVFKELKEVIMAASEKNGNFIYVSGHEHNLQYLENEEQTFIVSGAGSKNNASSLGKGAKFGYGKKGYSTIDFYEDGQAWTSFYVPNEDGTDAKLVFRQKTKDALSISEDNIPTEFPEYEALKDQKTISKLPTRNPVSEAGGFQKFILGEHYRSIYLQKYDFPILDLSEFKGGLSPLKRGGGNQTNSLRLEDPDGHQYVMRDLTKDVTRLLPPPFNKMGLTEYIALDNFLSTHPFAPLALAPLADAANIYHTNPKFYYIPKQPTLQVYNDNYGGSVYLVEERPGGDWEGQSVFGGTKKTYNTPDLSEKTLKNHKHKVDQNWALRSRLFDMVIGDWDRHDDQWRWARFDQEDGTRLYRPVPRDRDQAFSKYDGLVTRVATIASPFTHQLAVYGPEIKGNIKWAAWSPRNFDAQFLTELDWEDWEREATFLQKNITDELIEESFKAWPEFALAEDGDYIKSVLRKRRDRIVEFARRYYEFRAKKVDVIGTEDNELFEIQRVSDKETIVRMFELSKKGKKKDLVYERTFDNDITKEIHLYGNGNDDEFRITGEVNKGIKLRCIGGLGNDTFVDESKVKGLGKKTLFYDDNRKNSLTLGTEAKDKRTDEAIYNIYDRRAYQYEYNYTVPIPIIGVNPDDGFLLGATFLNTSYNFKKEPFSSQHRFGGRYAFQTESFEFNYLGDYLNTFGKLDFYLDATIKNSSYALNYFGYGNGSIANVDSLGIDFYRVRQGLVRIHPAFKKRLGSIDNYITFGPVFERSEIDNTPNRILIEDPEDNIPDDIFIHRNRIGAEFGFNYYNVDNRVVPHRGLNLIANAQWLNSLDDTKLNFTKLSGEMAVYQNLDRKENLILATRLGFGHIFGDLNEDFFFDDAPAIGGESPLRGYREQRFYGNTTFYANADLRLRLFTTHNRVLPFTMGIFGGYDIGRVWASNVEDDSDDWHSSYGGGLWFSPLDAFTLSLGAFVPKEDTEEQLRIVLVGGFSF
jgi:hypothetical protein